MYRVCNYLHTCIITRSQIDDMNNFMVSFFRGHLSLFIAFLSLKFVRIQIYILCVPVCIYTCSNATIICPYVAHLFAPPGAYLDCTLFPLWMINAIEIVDGLSFSPLILIRIGNNLRSRRNMTDETALIELIVEQRGKPFVVSQLLC